MINLKKWIPKLLLGRKDGGFESHVTAWGLEWKAVASVLILRFADGTRDAYHSHAFNAVSWLLPGAALHESFDPITPGPRDPQRWLYPSWWPVTTRRADQHRVYSHGTSWVVSFRGPWADEWIDRPALFADARRMTHGRKVVGLA